MRELVSAQMRFQRGPSMDEDLDGRGEYGSIGELSGLVNLVRNGVGVGAPLNPPQLPVVFQAIGVTGHAAVSGYMYVVYLPDSAIPPTGNSDVAMGGPSPNVDPNHCETLWCAYAWPIVLGQTGNRAFFVNQAGVVHQTPMNCMPYGGVAAVPQHSAAYTASGMTAPVASWMPGCDGNDWSPVL
jgi:hypothetical protein